MRLQSNRDQIVTEIQQDIHSKAFEDFVNQFQPLILTTVSDRLGRYVNKNNDDAYSVGLEAFCEAIQKYDIGKSSFIAFAKLVMTRRLNDFIYKKQQFVYENIDDNPVVDPSMAFDDELALKEEIQLLDQELQQFGIEFDDLVSESPKHGDTRQRTKKIAIKTSEENDLVNHLYKKKRLPVTEMCRRFMTTRKIIYGNKNYIISIVIVCIKKLGLIKTFI